MQQVHDLLKSSMAMSSNNNSNTTHTTSINTLFLALTLASFIHQHKEGNSTSTNKKSPSPSRKKKQESSSSDEDEEEDGVDPEIVSYRKTLAEIFVSSSSNTSSNSSSSSSISAFLPLLPLSVKEIKKIDKKSNFFQNRSAFCSASVPPEVALEGWSSSSSSLLVGGGESSNSTTITKRLPSWMIALVNQIQNHGGRSKFESSAKHAFKKHEIPMDICMRDLEEGAKPDKDQMNDGYLRSICNNILTSEEENSNNNDNNNNSFAFNLDKCRVLHSRERIPIMLTTVDSSRFILKADDDVRLESFAMMIVRWCNSVWEREESSRNNNTSSTSSSSPSSSSSSSSPVYAVPYDITALPSSAFECSSADEDKKKKKKPSSSGDENNATVGLVEFLKDTQSIHEVREELQEKQQHNSSSKEDAIVPFLQSLLQHENQKRRFLSSFVGACVTQYLLALKDRHNANILLRRTPTTMKTMNDNISSSSPSDNNDNDDENPDHQKTQSTTMIIPEWINIDYSFCLGRAPGGAFSLETAPFRIPDEVFHSLLMKSDDDETNGNENENDDEQQQRDKERSSSSSSGFPPANLKHVAKEELEEFFNKSFPFGTLLTDALLLIRKHFAELESIILAVPEESLKKLTCFTSSSEQKHPHQTLLHSFRKRLFLEPKKKKSNEEKEEKQENGDEDDVVGSIIKSKIHHLIVESVGSKGTKNYDSFQKKSNGILC